MWFEDLMLLALLASGVFFIGIPIFKFVKAVTPRKRVDPLVEAKARLEQARLEAEAAHLNKEAEKIYDHLYEETLQEDDEEHKQQEKYK